jgi:hypothetical protein
MIVFMEVGDNSQISVDVNDDGDQQAARWGYF